MWELESNNFVTVTEKNTENQRENLASVPMGNTVQLQVVGKHEFAALTLHGCFSSQRSSQTARRILAHRWFSFFCLPEDNTTRGQDTAKASCQGP